MLISLDNAVFFMILWVSAFLAVKYFQKLKPHKIYDGIDALFIAVCSAAFIA